MLWLLIAGILPLPDIAHDRVDAVEVSHFYDGDGRLVFDQVIFWQDGHVRAWRLFKTGDQWPFRSRGEYATIWFDGDRLRCVRAISYRETWEQHDRELDDREKFPAHLRAGLTGERPFEPPCP